jgi:hypothetical protein
MNKESQVVLYDNRQNTIRMSKTEFLRGVLYLTTHIVDKYRNPNAQF